jgi:hypothetical protein
MDFDSLAEVNARLVRAREEHREAVAAERQARAFSRRFSPATDEGRKQIQSAHQRVRKAVEEHAKALDEFIRCTTHRSASAVGIGDP